MRRDELNETERRVWDACQEGFWVDLSLPAGDPDPGGAAGDDGAAGDPVRGDPAAVEPVADGPVAADVPAGPVPQAGPVPAKLGEVRAAVLVTLLQQAPERVDGRVPALRLRGARITGRLDLSHVTVGLPVHLDCCVLDAAPDLTGASLRTLELRDCRLPGLDGRLMTVTGDLRLADCRVDGRLMLENSTITGSFSIGGCWLVNPGGRALSGGGMSVGGGFFGRRGLRAEGTVRIIGARIAGGVFLEGAALYRPGGVGLCADEVSTTRILCSDGFTCEGEVQLRGAQVSGEVNLFAATVLARRKAIRARGLTAGELVLAPDRVEGLADLSRARLGAIRDRRASWPQHLRLDGLTYEHLLPFGESLDAGARCAWLARDVDPYRPQPYEQLAGHYRRLGHDDEARRVLLAKLRRRRRTQRLPARLAGFLLDGLVGYGYRPWLAACWLAVLLAAGTAVFTARPPQAVDPAHQPTFDAFVYTLDLLVPIGAFGLRGFFVPHGATRWLAYGLIAAGWILATALIAGVSRSLRRD